MAGPVEMSGMAPSNPVPAGAADSDPKARAPRWVAFSVIGLVALTIGWFAVLAERSVSEFGDSDPAHAYYNRLITGFAQGRLDLVIDVPDGLKQLPDPYDPTANGPYRGWVYRDDRLHDTSYYHGRIYLYFGVTPALLLFWPFHVLTGSYLSHPAAVVVFASTGTIISMLLVWLAWRRYFRQVSGAVVLSIELALALATSVSPMLQRPEVWEVAVSAGYALTMGALLCLWMGLHAARGRVGWWLGTSLAYALAIGARPSLLPGAAILLIPLLATWRESTGRQRVTIALALAVPLLAIGTGLAWYNAARFDNPFEFGQSYQLADDRQDGGHFALRFLPYNLRMYFLAVDDWTGRFPFVRDCARDPGVPGHGLIERTYGMLTNTPATLYALLAGLLWWRGRDPSWRPLRRWCLGLAGLAGVNALVLGLFYGGCLRYQVEMHPELMLLAAVGVLGLATFVPSARWRRVGLTVWLGAAFVSCGYGALKSWLPAGDRCFQLGLKAERKGDIGQAVRWLEQAGSERPDWAEPRFALGSVLSSQKRFEEARVCFQEAVRLDPTHVGAMHNLGEMLRRTGRVVESIACYQAATRINPRFDQSWFSMGAALLELGRYDEAVAALNTAITCNPASGEAHYVLAIALHDMGRLTEAREHYRRAIELHVPFPPLSF